MAIPGPEVSNRLKQKCRLTKVAGQHPLSTNGDCAFKETQPRLGNIHWPTTVGIASSYLLVQRQGLFLFHGAVDAHCPAEIRSQ